MPVRSGYAFVSQLTNFNCCFSVVWFILVIELSFEYLLRPTDYQQLIKSEKAFAPSTARHINRYHLFCEAIALLLFVTHFPCAFLNKCGGRLPFSSVQAGLYAVVGATNADAALGRFVLGLTFLRAFGLVRRWKQMWINLTFEEAKEYRNRTSTSLFLSCMVYCVAHSWKILFSQQS